MAEDLKTVRLPFMVTQAEAEAIDEWRYKHKIPTRAEAMRRLINYGLKQDNYMVAVAELITFLAMTSLKYHKVEGEYRSVLETIVSATSKVTDIEDFVASLPPIPSNSDLSSD